MSTSESGRTLPFESALVEVVRSLHKEDPLLVFGIGAGIILVGALTVTTSLVAVLIVAALLVVVLLGRLVALTQAKRGQAVFARAFLIGARHDHVRAANVKASSLPGGGVKTRAWSLFARGKKGEYGNVTIGGRSDREDS